MDICVHACVDLNAVFEGALTTLLVFLDYLMECNGCGKDVDTPEDCPCHDQ